MCRSGKTFATCRCGAPVLCAYEFECRDCSAKTYEWIMGNDDDD